MLKRAGVVTSHREGPAVVYELTGPDVADLLRVARRILAELLAEQQRLLDELRADVPSWAAEAEQVTPRAGAACGSPGG